MSNDLNRQYEGVDLRNVGFATLGPRITLPRLQAIMARGWDIRMALELRRYLQSIDDGKLDWEAELDAIADENRKQDPYLTNHPSQDAA